MGNIKVHKNVAGIEGLCVIEPEICVNNKKYFMETYNQKDMKDAGLDMVFVQDNQSMSVKCELPVRFLTQSKLYA